MIFHKHFLAVMFCFALGAGFGSVVADAQRRTLLPTTGTIKGRIRAAEGTSGNISITVRQGEREIAHASTGSKGDFVFTNLQPGDYGLTFRKPGLQVGRVEDLTVKAGRVVDLGDRVLQIDEGSLAFIKGSVFDKEGRSVRGAKVELTLLRPDGTSRKIGSSVTNSIGSFAFRLNPATARYRVTAKGEGAEPASKEVEVDGAAIFRVALELLPKTKS